MTTARSLITRSLQLLGVLGEGETPTAATAQDVLYLWNGLIELWSIGGQTAIYQETTEIFALTAGKQSYTIGTGQDFNTTRPSSITAAFIRDTGGYDQTIELIGAERYAAIVDKDLPGTPYEAYYDGGFPTGRIIFNLKPGAGLAFHMISQKPLSSITSLDTVLAFPPGYEMAYLYNLPVLAAPLFEREAPATVRGMAHEFSEKIMEQNTRNDDTKAQVDVGLSDIGRCGSFWGY